MRWAVVFIITAVLWSTAPPWLPIVFVIGYLLAYKLEVLQDRIDELEMERRADRYTPDEFWLDEPPLPSTRQTSTQDPPETEPPSAPPPQPEKPPRSPERPLLHSQPSPSDTPPPNLTPVLVAVCIIAVVLAWLAVG